MSAQEEVDMPTSEKRVRTRDGVHLRKAGSETILYDTGGKKVHVLNTTASMVWELCGKEKGEAEIAEILSGKFAVPIEEARSDVSTILGTFAELSLIEPA